MQIIFCKRDWKYCKFLFSKRLNLLYRAVICQRNIAPYSSADWIKLLKRLNRYRAWSGVWSTVSSNQSQDRNADEAHVNHAILSSRHHRPHPMETPRAGFARFKAYYIFSLHLSPSSPRVSSLFSILALPFWSSLSRTLSPAFSSRYTFLFLPFVFSMSLSFCLVRLFSFSFFFSPPTTHPTVEPPLSHPTSARTLWGSLASRPYETNHPLSLAAPLCSKLRHAVSVFFFSHDTATRKKV